MEEGMHPTLKIFSGGKLFRRATRWQLSAVLGAAAVVGTGTVLTASPAHADTFRQSCNTYHQWTECVSYDYTNGVVAVNALNGYPAQQNNVSVAVSVDNQPFSEVFNIPSGNWRGFAVYNGFPPNEVCGSINTVLIVCGSF
jgi:hypothetical protein